MTYRIRLVLWTVGLWLALALAIGLLVGFYASRAGWLDPATTRGYGLVLAWFGSLLVPGLIAVLATAWFVAKAASRPIDEFKLALRSMRPTSLAEESVDIAYDVGEIASPELRAELIETRQRMADALSAQERFIANVSHEFRTPIAVLLAETDVLLKTRNDLPDDAEAFAKSVREEMLRLKQMVDGFLLLIQIEHGKRRPPDKKVYVFDELLEVAGGLKAFAEPYGVKLDVKLESDAELDAFVVRGDAGLFRQMVSNLVRNAVRFSPRDASVELFAALENADERFECGSVAVWVRDYGPGVPKQVAEHLFDRFVQAPTEHRRGRGTGLGLEIAQSVAELHNGRIAVTNLDDGGCEFRVQLPRERISVDG